jgi:hypothetical protein
MEFNTLDVSTWTYADNETLQGSFNIDGKTVYIYQDNDIVKCKLSYFIYFMNNVFKFLERNGNSLTNDKKNKAVYNMLVKLYYNNTDIEKMKLSNTTVKLNEPETDFALQDYIFFNKLPKDTQEEFKKLDKMSKDLKENLKLDMSKEVYCDYQLTLAQAAVLSYCTTEEKEKICKIVQQCKSKKLGKNKLRQMLFDNNCKTDTYLFSDLVNCVSKSEEKSLMLTYFYFEFDNLSDIKDDCYLKKNPNIWKDIEEFYDKFN